MATYKEIAKYIKDEYGVNVKSCHIAHAKELSGIKTRKAHNRNSEHKRAYPCPSRYLAYMKNAFEHFNMINEE